MAETSIDLTYDELVVACELLGLELPVGVVIDDIEYPESIRQRLRANARSALVARRILDATGDPPAVNEAVATLLGITAQPGLIASVECQRGPETETTFLLTDPDIGVAVSAIAPSAYRLTPFVTRDLLHRVLRITDLRPADSPAVAGARLRAGDLDRVIEIVAGDPFAALDHLRDRGLAEPAAEALTEALRDLRAAVTVSTMHHASEDVIVGGIVSWLDCGLAGNWLSEAIDDADAGDDLVELRPAGAKEILAEIVKGLPDAFASQEG